ncbi:hypothetical protein ANCCEY_11375 [Ancylostoma ceylanicum]|uniref:Splicing factor cactin central domain-containing protein n=1 Tax=Ancylostoma ceylanicum TaxID=53326 RepID=A0A0D6LEA1_9BILA|nr:hypothetical protein ANCCEY_11375 [Ancylostoma ceylanicum]
MSHHSKKSKERKRSRSRERDSRKKSKHKRHSSSSSEPSVSSDSDHGDRFQSVLDKQREEKRRQKRLEKERLKQKETPEEKRARRLAKKLKKVRSNIRIEQNRAKPIDLLSRYIQFGDESNDGKDEQAEFELEDPLKYLKGLTQDDYEDLVEDIKVYRSLDRDRHSDFWKDVRCVIDDELRKLRDDRGRLGTSIHGSVQQDVDKIFKVKEALPMPLTLQNMEFITRRHVEKHKELRRCD